MNVSIVMPAYNEEKRIAKTLKSYASYFNTFSKKHKMKYELLVVINGTTDNTVAVVKQMKKKYSSIRFLDLKQGGKGYAVLEGFKDALKRKNDLIGFVDADLATPPKEYGNLILNIRNSAGIIANRYLPESRVTPALTFRRVIVGKTFNILVRGLFLLPYTDTQCGAKLFTRNATQHITKEVVMSQWAFDVELLYKLHKHNFNVAQLPTDWSDIDGGSLKVGRASIEMFLAVLQLRITHSVLRRFLKPAQPIIDSLRGFL